MQRSIYIPTCIKHIYIYCYIIRDVDYSENAWVCAKWQWNARNCVTGLHDRRICFIALMNLGETCHLKRRDFVTVWRTMLLLCFYRCDCLQQHYDVTQFECVLWRHTMHEYVMNIQYQTWIAQGWFINISLTPSKKWGMCDKKQSVSRN